MSDRHIVKAMLYDIDTNQLEEREFEVSDDVYKIITNGIGASYSIGDESRQWARTHLEGHLKAGDVFCRCGMERAQARTDSED